MQESTAATFDLSNAMLSSAIRQQLVALARAGRTRKDLAIFIVSSCVFATVVYTQAHWIGWVSGLPLLFAIAQGATLLASYVWLPRKACARLRYLPHRTTTVELTAEGITIQNATEKLDIRPAALASLTRLPDFWLVATRYGTFIPVPVSAIPASMQEKLERLRETLPVSDRESDV